MAEDETRRWRGWRTSQPDAPIKGSQPTKPPGTKKRKRNRPTPWFWIKNKRKGQRCEGCDKEVRVGQVVAFARPKKVRCRTCIERTGLKPKVSTTLAKERRERVEDHLRQAAGRDRP